MEGIKSVLGRLCNTIIGASLSEPHINECAQYNNGICIYVWYMVRPSSARRFIDSVRTYVEGMARPAACNLLC